MSTILLMRGIKQLIEAELKAYDLKYMQSVAPLKYSTPKVYLGGLPLNKNEYDFPYIIVSPNKMIINDELTTFEVDILFGVSHENMKDDPESYDEIISLTERVVAILNNNKIVSKMFKLAGEIAYIFEIRGNMAQNSLSAISLMYEKPTGRFNPSDEYE